ARDLVAGADDAVAAVVRQAHRAAGQRHRALDLQRGGQARAVELDRAARHRVGDELHRAAVVGDDQAGGIDVGDVAVDLQDAAALGLQRGADLVGDGVGAGVEHQLGAEGGANVAEIVERQPAAPDGAGRRDGVLVDQLRARDLVAGADDAVAAVVRQAHRAAGQRHRALDLQRGGQARAVELDRAARHRVGDELHRAAVVGDDQAGGIDVGDVAVDLQDAAALGLQRGADLVGDGVGAGVEHQLGAEGGANVAEIVERQPAAPDGAGRRDGVLVDQLRARDLVAGADDAVAAVVRQAHRAAGQRHRALDLQRGGQARAVELDRAARHRVGDELHRAAVVGDDQAGGIDVGDVAVDLQDAAALGLQRGADLVGDGVGAGVEHQLGAEGGANVAEIVERQPAAPDGAGRRDGVLVDQLRARDLVAGADDAVAAVVRQAHRAAGQRHRALDLQRGGQARAVELDRAARHRVGDELHRAAVVGDDQAGGIDVGDVAVDLQDAAALGLQRGADLVGDGVGAGVEHQLGAEGGGDVAEIVERQPAAPDAAGPRDGVLVDQLRARDLVAGADDAVAAVVRQAHRAAGQRHRALDLQRGGQARAVELDRAARHRVGDELHRAAVVGDDQAGGIDVGDVAVDLQDAAALGLQRGADLVGDGVGAGVEHQLGAEGGGDVAEIVERQPAAPDGAGPRDGVLVDQLRARDLGAGADDAVAAVVRQAHRAAGQRHRALDLQRGGQARAVELDRAARHRV